MEREEELLMVKEEEEDEREEEEEKGKERSGGGGIRIPPSSCLRVAYACMEEVERKRGERGLAAAADEGGGADENDGMLADMQADIIFSDGNNFPSLPHFPRLISSPSNACPSSSSSSSLSSSSASWCAETQQQKQKHAVVVAASTAVDDVSMTIPSPPSDQHYQPPAIDSDGSTDLLEEVDLLCSTDGLWDPSSLFPDDDDDDGAMDSYSRPVTQHDRQQEQQLRYLSPEREGGGGRRGTLEADLAMVFFEWLRSNKESISPQDLRSIKLRRSTIEYAARRLGGGKEGMKQLLKLILTWVQNHHLQKRRPPGDGGGGGGGDQEQHHHHHHRNIISSSSLPHQHQQLSFLPHLVRASLPNASTTTDPNPCNPNPSFNLVPRPNCGHGLSACNSWATTAGDPTVPGCASLMKCFSSNFHTVDPISAWPPPHHPPLIAPPGKLPPPYPGGFPGQRAMGRQLFHQGRGEPLERQAPSATKEARKKRMARQRRFSPIHHHHHRHRNQQLPHHQQQQQQQLQHRGLPIEELCSPAAAAAGEDNSTPASWLIRPSPSSSTSPQMIMPADADLLRGHPPPERRQGWKAEKNLMFLLQKVLKQSDVGNLGRIVLPKKEAEMHLPELEERDGISIAMEDIGTSLTWNMRYRFWPNNKSRMYLLENTGDFVRLNGLQEGDFIVIYSEVNCGKYMIRGVKVRQQMDSKVDGRNNAGKQMLLHRNGPNSTSKKRALAAAAGSRQQQQKQQQREEGKKLKCRLIPLFPPQCEQLHERSDI